MSDWIEWMGAVAAVLTTSSFLPQVAQTWRTKSASDFSWIWLSFFSIGLFLWLLYGLANQSTPLIAANGLTLGLVLLIAFVKARYSSGSD